MRTLAAVLFSHNCPLEIVELEIPKLKKGQVLVDISYSGICHTQVLEWRGFRGPDPYIPHCLGHEGSGTVVEIGSGVTKVKSGDRVILSWIKGSGIDAGGSVYESSELQKVNAGPITTFSQKAVISENRLTVIPNDLPLKTASLIGCALPTGLGAVFNVAQPIPGQSLAIFGIGGIGLTATMAAQLNGCHPIIAIDLLESKLDLARRLGATHLINATQGSIVDQIKQICSTGVDFAVEATGRPKAMGQAIESLSPQGGTVVIVGNARYGEKLEIDPSHFNQGKRVLGTWGGNSNPDRDYPRYAQMAISEKLNLDFFLSHQEYQIEEVNQALTDLEQGKCLRPILSLLG